MIPRYIFQKVSLLLVVGLLGGCAPRSEPPTVNEISVQPDTTLMTGETATLTINASGTDLTFEWTVNRGSLSDPGKAAVIYTAPNSPGPDVVTVKVTYSGGEVIRTIPLSIISPPTMTVAVTQAPVDTSTVVPESISCNSPAVTKNLFPQLADEDGQISFYGPVDEPKYACEAVYDVVHNQPLAVHIKYENAGANFGWWGIGTPKGYDASSYNQICFWAYAQQPNQSFRLKMKDTSRKENGVIITLEPANQWTQICTDLTKLADLGIKLKSLENVNLGFEQPTGTAEVWVADFEFK
jgi:hypothetical protein